MKQRFGPVEHCECVATGFTLEIKNLGDECLFFTWLLVRSDGREF